MPFIQSASFSLNSKTYSAKQKSPEDTKESTSEGKKVFTSDNKNVTKCTIHKI